MIWIYGRVQGFFCFHSLLVDLIENARGGPIKSLAEIEFGSHWLIPISVVDCIQFQEHKSQFDATGISKQMLAAVNAIKHLMLFQVKEMVCKNRALRQCRENELFVWIHSWSSGLSSQFSLSLLSQTASALIVDKSSTCLSGINLGEACEHQMYLPAATPKSKSALTLVSRSTCIIGLR